MYRVLEYFTDLQDDGYAYHEGDTFPREGVEVTEDRIKELSTRANKRGIPLIEAIADKKIPKKAVSEVTGEPVEEKTDVSPSESEKPKKRARKTQE